MEKELTGPQIVAVYNSIAATLHKPLVKKFRTLALAKARLELITKEKNAKDTVPVKTKKRDFDDDAIIEVIDLNHKKRETKAYQRLKTISSLKDLTIKKFYEDRLGSTSDLKWWIERGKIKIKKG
jgi:hypothetical protein